MKNRHGSDVAPGADDPAVKERRTIEAGHNIPSVLRARLIVDLSSGSFQFQPIGAFQGVVAVRRNNRDRDRDPFVALEPDHFIAVLGFFYLKEAAWITE